MDTPGVTVPLIGGLAFVGLVLLTVCSAAMVAFSRNIVHSAFALLGTFFGVAGLYLFISADFVGVIQVMVYVGGVLILFLFAVMLTGQIQDVKVSNLSRGVWPGLLVLLGTLGLLGYVVLEKPWHSTSMTAPVDQPTTVQIGDALLGEFVLPFEVASVLLLAALVGGVMIAGGVRRRAAPAAGAEDEGGDA